MAKNRKLHIVWTSADYEVADKFVFMYAINSMLAGCWDSVNIIIKGPSALLVANDKRIQTKIQEALIVGVTFEACSSSASLYFITDKLTAQEINLREMDIPLTEYIQANEYLITV